MKVTASLISEQKTCKACLRGNCPSVGRELSEAEVDEVVKQIKPFVFSDYACKHCYGPGYTIFWPSRFKWEKRRCGTHKVNGQE